MTALGLSCSMQDLSLRRVGFSLVVVCRYFFSLSSCGPQGPGHVGSLNEVCGRLIAAASLVAEHGL